MIIFSSGCHLGLCVKNSCRLTILENLIQHSLDSSIGKKKHDKHPHLHHHLHHHLSYHHHFHHQYIDPLSNVDYMWLMSDFRSFNTYKMVSSLCSTFEDMHFALFWVLFISCIHDWISRCHKVIVVTIEGRSTNNFRD